MTPARAAPPKLESLSRVEVERRLDDLIVRLELVEDTDHLLDHYARHHGDDLDMMPYYAMLWPSAEALVEYIVESPVAMRNKRVLELGCGLGYPSIVCSKLGAKVVATDFHPDCLPLLRRNVSLNALQEFETYCLDWGQMERAEFDIVLGSDLLYEERNIESLAQGLARIRRPGCRVLLSDPGRDHLQAAVNRICDVGFTQTTHVVRNCFVVAFSCV